MKNDIEKFIERFRGDNLDLQEDEKNKIVEYAINKYTNGYCYFFAKMLQAAFQRGEVVILAPHSHLVWRDTDGKLYDITGEVSERDYEDFECQIEEGYLGDALKDFLCRENYYNNTTWDEIVQLINEAKKRNS